MAELSFRLYDGQNKCTEPQRIISYELASETDAACDGLRLSFFAEEKIGEITRVEAFEGKSKIFTGFADKQTLSTSESGKRVFIYARSSAALLVDNEALPCQYHHPSARQLWFHNAREFGFDFGLPVLYCDKDYYVSKGTSCFGAINDFFKMLYSRGIYVDANNVIRAFEKSQKLKTLEGSRVVSAAFTVNRSKPLSQIDYKINASDEYCYHLKSRFAEKSGIARRRLINLSALPLWQREAVAKNRLESSYSELYTLELELAGTVDFRLYDRAKVNLKGVCEGRELLVYQLVKSKNDKGEKTLLRLRAETEGELINYVA